MTLIPGRHAGGHGAPGDPDDSGAEDSTDATGAPQHPAEPQSPTEPQSPAEPERPAEPHRSRSSRRVSRKKYRPRAPRVSGNCRPGPSGPGCSAAAAPHRPP